MALFALGIVCHRGSFIFRSPVDELRLPSVSLLCFLFCCSALILGASGGVGTFAIQVKGFLNLVAGKTFVHMNL